MTSTSKAKGNRFERELVNKAKEYGLDAKRAYASNGLSLGKTEDVDILLEDKCYQAKCRKVIGDLYKPGKNVFAQVFKEDRGEIFVMLRFDDYLQMLKSLKHYNDLREAQYRRNVDSMLTSKDW